MRQIFQVCIFCLVKKKKISDLQVFSRIGKTVKKLQWIPNTIMNISVIEYFDNVYISDGIKTALSTHALGNILLPVLEHVRGVIRGVISLQRSTMVLLAKIVSNANLKTLTILSKRFIFDAWLGPGRASADWYITVLKIQTNIWIILRKTESF